LPSSGWRSSGDHGVRYYDAANNFPLPFRQFSFVLEEEGRPAAFAHAFFCVYEDLAAPAAPGAVAVDATTIEVTRWMIAERCKMVWTGLRNPGQQVLELIIVSRQQLTAEVAEKKFAETLPSLVRVGNAEGTASTTR
jgi:hypothetical protein